MKITAVEKCILKFVAAVTDLSEKVEQHSPEDKKDMISAIKYAEKSVKRLEVIIENLKTKEPKRVNRLSARLFKEFNYTCRVCGTRDDTCESLSRCRLVKEPAEDTDYIILCKEHKEEFNKKLNWKSRNMEASYTIINDMIDRNNK